jgi:hypothetical protein
MATLRKIQGETATRLISGKMYLYRYQAESEYYNRFPLIFMLRKRGNLFEGIDFHYIDPERRVELFENMRSFFSTKDITENTILFVKKFRTIMQRSKIFRSAIVSFRKYKKENIKSKIIEINPNDWLTALQQPAEMFVTLEGRKIKSMVIWKETLKLQRKR